MCTSSDVHTSLSTASCVSRAAEVRGVQCLCTVCGCAEGVARRKERERERKIRCSTKEERGVVCGRQGRRERRERRRALELLSEAEEKRERKIDTAARWKKDSRWVEAVAGRRLGLGDRRRRRRRLSP